MEEIWATIAENPMLWLEAHRTPWLDAIFIGFTLLGVEAFLLFFVALGFWLLDRRVFARAAGMLVVSAWLNSLLKGIFLAPRPQVSHVLEAGGWSFPSGHAQVAAAFWGWLAVEFARSRPSTDNRRLPVVGLLWGLAALIAASRPYLGVHYPHDVLAGFFFGGAQVALAAFASHRWAHRAVLFDKAWIVALLGLAVSLFIFHPSVAGLGVRLSGAGFGLALAWRLISKWTDVSRRRALTAVFGVVGLLSLWLGLKAVLRAVGLGEVLFPAFIRYALIGLWIGYGAPALARLSTQRMTSGQ